MQATAEQYLPHAHVKQLFEQANLSEKADRDAGDAARIDFNELISLFVRGAIPLQYLDIRLNADARGGRDLAAVAARRLQSGVQGKGGHEKKKTHAQLSQEAHRTKLLEVAVARGSSLELDGESLLRATPERELELAAQVFVECDACGDGVLALDEFIVAEQTLARRRGQAPSAMKAKAAFKRLDGLGGSQGDGVVDFVE